MTEIDLQVELTDDQSAAIKRAAVGPHVDDILAAAESAKIMWTLWKTVIDGHLSVQWSEEGQEPLFNLTEQGTAEVEKLLSLSGANVQ